jgi:hypothetical protein
MGITDQGSVRAEVTGGGRSGGGGGRGQGSGGGAHGSLVMPRTGGCGFFIIAMGTKTSGRPDASDARTEAFPSSIFGIELLFATLTILHPSTLILQSSFYLEIFIRFCR